MLNAKSLRYDFSFRPIPNEKLRNASGVNMSFKHIYILDYFHLAHHTHLNSSEMTYNLVLSRNSKSRNKNFPEYGHHNGDRW